MFDPKDFYNFADEIKIFTSRYIEAQQRTQASRIYYSCFLAIREIIRNSLASTPEKAQYDQLSRSQYVHGAIDQIVTIADHHTRSLLVKLKKNRQLADYELVTSGRTPALITNQSFYLGRKILTQKIPSLPSLVNRNLATIEILVKKIYEEMQKQKMTHSIV
jgi:hypothetical protein